VSIKEFKSRLCSNNNRSIASLSNTEQTNKSLNKLGASERWRLQYDSNVLLELALVATVEELRVN